MDIPDHTTSWPPKGCSLSVQQLSHMDMPCVFMLHREQLQRLLVACSCTCEAADEDCQHYRQGPADHVYNWSAFNKLLLLGMYAPVEEAEAAEHQQTQLVLQQLQDVASARQVSVIVAGTLVLLAILCRARVRQMCCKHTAAADKCQCGCGLAVLQLIGLLVSWSA